MLNKPTDRAIIHPEVSVIIGTYNRANVLPRAVQSVLDQTITGWELLIVDDASTDHTEDVVAQFDDARIKYIRSTANGGPGRTRNLGIDSARGRYIGFLDDDDVWLPEKLAQQLHIFQGPESEKIGAVACGRIVRTGSGDRYVYETASNDMLAQLLKHNTGISTSGILVRKDVLDTGIRFDLDSMFEDQDLLIQIARTKTIAVVPSPLYILHRDEQIGRRYNVQLVIDGLNDCFRRYRDDFEREPSLSDAHHRRLSVAYRSIGDKGASLSSAARVVKTAPTDVRSYLFLGSMALRSILRSGVANNV